MEPLEELHVELHVEPQQDGEQVPYKTGKDKGKLHYEYNWPVLGREVLKARASLQVFTEEIIIVR